MEAGRFDAAFLAIGAHIGKRIDIPARDASRMVTAVSLLRDAATGAAPKLGRRVVVYGGGNTAMDAARTAKRLGAEEAIIVYRSDRAHMKAQAFEAQEAIEEGVKIKWLTSIKSLEGTDLTVEEMELGADGRPKPTGRLETLSADAVVLAVGQETDSGFLRKIPGIEFQSDGVVVVAPNMMTGHPGIFAGGDMVPTERTVTAGVGHGKKAARHIDAWLRGSRLSTGAQAPDRFVRDAAPAGLQRRGAIGAEDAAGRGAHRRVHGGAGWARAQRRRPTRRRRCLSCGNCFECDQCYAACPEQAIAKLGPGHRLPLPL